MSALVVAFALLAATPAIAAPASSDSTATPVGSFQSQLSEKQSRVDAFLSELDGLDRDLEIASEKYNEATDRLDIVRQQVEAAKSELAKAQLAYDTQSALLSERANSIYKNGPLNTMELLLASDSFGDLITRIRFLNAIGSADAQAAASLKGQREYLEQQVAALEAAEQEAEGLEFELKARQIEISLRITERQQMYEAAQADLLDLLDSEAATRRLSEADLLQAVLNGTAGRGVSVQAGSPAETALGYFGIPYLWGGSTPRAFDCSGLVQYVFAQHGVSLPHYSGSQYAMGSRVSAGQLEPGDAVFFGSPVHHVGIYIGGGYFIHAPRTGDFVKISRLATRSDYVGARRYAWQPRTAPIRGAVTSVSSALSGIN